MRKIKFRHLFSLFRLKIGILVFVNFLYFTNLFAQTKNLEFFDQSKWIHFGFCLGINYTNFRYQFSNNFYKNDTLRSVDIKKYPGIHLGAISDIHLGEFFDFRVIPSIILTQRTITYNFTNSISQDMPIESILADIPMLFKYKSTRHNNVRFYVIGGGDIGYDFSSNIGAIRDQLKPIVIIKPWNYSYDFGCGLDLYFEWFKFSPEIKFSKGINNILSPYNDVYSGSFSKIFSNCFYFSLNFEG